MNSFMYISNDYQKCGKIIIHKETEETPNSKSIKKLLRNMELMYLQWMEDYQTHKNISNGVAGSVEIFQ